MYCNVQENLIPSRLLECQVSTRSSCSSSTLKGEFQSMMHQPSDILAACLNLVLSRLYLTCRVALFATTIPLLPSAGWAASGCLARWQRLHCHCLQVFSAQPRQAVSAVLCHCLSIPIDICSGRLVRTFSTSSTLSRRRCNSHGYQE